MLGYFYLIFFFANVIRVWNISVTLMYGISFECVPGLGLFLAVFVW